MQVSKTNAGGWRGCSAISGAPCFSAVPVAGVARLELNTGAALPQVMTPFLEQRVNLDGASSQARAEITKLMQPVNKQMSSLDSSKDPKNVPQLLCQVVVLNSDAASYHPNMRILRRHRSQ